MYSGWYLGIDDEFISESHYGTRRVLSFTLGMNHRTQTKEWGAFQEVKSTGQRIFCVPAPDSRQPTSPNEVWYSTDVPSPEGDEDRTKVVHVKLRQLLFSGEVTVNFFRDRRNRWYGIAVEEHIRHVGDINCVPDKTGHLQPSDDKLFWVCTYKLAANVGQGDRMHVVAVMNLLREDVAAKERDRAERTAREEEQKAAALALAQLVEGQWIARERQWAEDARRYELQQQAEQAREQARVEFEKSFPTLVANQHRLEKVERIESIVGRFASQQPLTENRRNKPLPKFKGMRSNFR